MGAVLIQTGTPERQRSLTPERQRSLTPERKPKSVAASPEAEPAAPKAVAPDEPNAVVAPHNARATGGGIEAAAPPNRARSSTLALSYEADLFATTFGSCKHCGAAKPYPAHDGAGRCLQ